ncbi:MAG TPA: galactose-1-phosphate uridylyltransferase [Chitinivibrionales bacterium]|nr:galactose-1-phosphate uridylyltransferase [Chitinivibrionales bacterium]
MSEIRQNLISREWVIIATERAKRPDHFLKPSVKKTPASHVPDCPFCTGNEEKNTPGETYRHSDDNGWKVRVVPNRYPTLVSEGDRVRSVNGIYRTVSGVGIHEVIIEHPAHNLTIALMSQNEVADILRAYRSRYREIRKDPRIECIIIFKNHGEAAGASLEHPHSQLVATPIVPSQVRDRIQDAIHFLDNTGECVFCNMLRLELAAKERIVHESNHFVAFVPFAALSPFHLWLFPRRHTSSFDDISDQEIDDLALNLKTVLAKLYHGLGNPDFNYCIRSVPTDEHQSEYFHWYLAIIPKVIRTAGFELGSGIFVNTALPEASAKFLREVSPAGDDG